MATFFRLLQFLIAGVVFMYTRAMKILYKIFKFLAILCIIIILVLSLFGKNAWDMAVQAVISCAVLFLLSGFPEQITDFIYFIFGSLFNEKNENEKIFKEYEDYFFKWYENEYSYNRSSGSNRQNQYHNNYNSQYSDQSYQQNNGYSESKAYNSNDIIKEYDEYLKYLGINRNNVSLSEIKKYYRKKMKDIHPDKNPGIDTTEEAQKLNSIKDFLEANLEYYLKKRGN